MLLNENTMLQIGSFSSNEDNHRTYVLEACEIILKVVCRSISRSVCRYVGLSVALSVGAAFNLLKSL